MHPTDRPLTISEAAEIQAALKARLRVGPLRSRPQTVAGVDAAFSEASVFAAAALYAFPGLVPLEDAVAVDRVRFPYVPGFLAFREAEAIADAVERLSRRPELLLVDGQGIAHPGGFGIACQLGVVLGIPSVGCAKSRLVGRFADPGEEKGSRSRLVYGGRTVGLVLRTRRGARPVFVSPGHEVDVAGAADLVMACTAGFRIPEPLRKADFLANDARRRVRGGPAGEQRPVKPTEDDQPKRRNDV